MRIGSDFVDLLDEKSIDQHGMGCYFCKISKFQKIDYVLDYSMTIGSFPSKTDYCRCTFYQPIVCVNNVHILCMN